MAIRAGHDELLARAARALREQPQPGWVDITDRVVAAVRATPRHGWPIRVAVRDVDDRGGADTVHVSDRVVVAVVRSRLAGLPASAPARIEMRLDGDRCTGARVELVAAYGNQLQRLADDARRVVLACLAELLGPHEGGDLQVDVHVQDVTPGDPRR